MNPGARRAAAAAALVVVLLLAASLAAGSAAGTAPAPPSPAGIYDALAEALAVFLVALALLTIGVTVWVLWAPPPAGRPRRGRPWMVRTIAMMAILTWGVILALRTRHRFGAFGSNAASVGRPLPSQAGGPAALPADPAGYIGGIAVLALVAFLVWLRWRRAPARKAQPEAVLAGVDASLLELGSAKDARDAVVRAYATMERVFADRGLGRGAPEAPAEYLERLLRTFPGAGYHGRRLTALYHEARFSPHPVDESMRTSAEQQLESIRGAVAGATPP